MVCMKYSVVIFLSAVLFFLWPGVAFANAGTAFLYLQILHLVFLNFFITLFEFLYLLKKYVIDNTAKNTLLILVGNVLSAGIGIALNYLIMALMGINILDPTKDQYHFQHIIFFIGAYIVSIGIELPFFRKVLKTAQERYSLFNVVIVTHLYSYLLIIVVYIILEKIWT